MLQQDKPMRASVACNLCRDSKLKCMNNNDSTKCQRCSLLDLPCSYTLKKSQLKKRSLKNYIASADIDVILPSLPPKRQYIRKYHTASPPFGKQTSTQFARLPDKDMIVEVCEIYFENQYKGIFPILHKPSFLSFIRSSDFNPQTYFEDYYKKYFEANYSSSLKYPDPVILLAVLALCARLHPVMPKIYGEFDESNPHLFEPNFNGRDIATVVDNYSNNAASNASNYFGWHARNLLKEVFDSPTIQRVQALTILSSHEWGEGHVSRSYLYVGIASRMALVLGLGHEDGLVEPDDSKLDESTRFLCIESKRRTIWAVYMMDRCNSSGRHRSSCIKLDDIRVKLPCQEKDFLFGNYRQQSLTFEEANGYIHNPTKKEMLNETSCFGFLIILFETWAKIAKWVGEKGGKLEKLHPWDTESEYYKLSKELDTFKQSLPQHLEFNLFNLEAHIADGSAADFAYFHGLFFLCRIFLNREYFFVSPESFPEGWWERETRILLETLDELASITRILKPINKMVIAPFTGFQVFTAAATSLYFHAFPGKILSKYLPFDTEGGYDTPTSEPAKEWQAEALKQKYELLALENMEALISWKKYWGLGEGWCETCLKLQKLFNNISREKPTPLQDDDLRHTMHDYGDGKVKEVYKPQYVRDRKHMQILNLLVSDDLDSSPRSLVKSGVLQPSSELIEISADEVVSNGINSPAFDFMNNLDLSHMFNGWNDAMKI